ncbi:MAG: hypothetical protein K0R07_1822, partial [Sedimentibacter sp.]|nr:hypothetical protein [Sedimentibacter sp.]
MKTLKQWRIPLLIIIDCVLINAAYILSLCFRFSFSIPKEYLGSYKNGILIILLVY